MDAGRFDALTRAFSADGTRRGLIRLFAALPLTGALVEFLGGTGEARRRRRKARHHPGKDKDRRKRKRKQRKRKHRKCRPDPLTQTCAGKCGTVENNCGRPVECEPCVCGSPCSECQECAAESGQCVANPDMVGKPCGEPGQVCQTNGECACDADSCAACATCLAEGSCSTPCDETGCCDSGSCEQGTADGACGTGGEPCQRCTGTGVTCGGGGQEGVCGCTPETVCPAPLNCGSIDNGCGTGTIECGPNCEGTTPICVNNVCAPCSDEHACPGEARCCEGACLTAEMCCEDEECAPRGNSCTGFECHCGTGDACPEDTPHCCGEPGACTDTQSDPANCGECGRECEPYEACKSGTCACDVCAGAACEFDSLTEAISQAQSGDTIHICPGRYQEMLTIRQDLHLIGAGGGAELTDTVIDANGAGTVLVIQEGVTASLTALHITGGQAADGAVGGGIQHEGMSLTMTNCTVANNAAGAAGGILNNTGTLTMTNCTVSDNTATTQGGGLLSLGGDMTLTDCAISGNTAVEQGGGLMVLGGTVTLIGTEVVMNEQTAISDPPNKPGGGGIFIAAGGAVGLENGCNVEANSAAAGLGGGIYNLGSVAVDESSTVGSNDPDDCVNGPTGIATGIDCPAHG